MITSYLFPFDIFLLGGGGDGVCVYVCDVCMCVCESV